VVVVFVCGVWGLEEGGELFEVFVIIVRAEPGYVFDDEGLGPGVADVVDCLLVEESPGVCKSRSVACAGKGLAWWSSAVEVDVRGEVWALLEVSVVSEAVVIVVDVLPGRSVGIRCKDVSGRDV
jgi:hypothetical protein